MAEEKPVVAVPPSNLSDLFTKKSKKKLGSNLNNATSGKKEEASKGVKKDAQEDDWQEEEAVVASILKVEAAGKLTRDEDKKDEDESSAPAWNTHKNKTDTNINEKKYPSLAKSVTSSNINIDDGSDRQINIQTSKNAFSALGGDQDSDDEGGKKRPKEIKPALVQKKKGERVTDVIKCEVAKYASKKDPKASKKPKNDDDSEEEEDSDEEEEEDVEEVNARKDAAAEARRKEKAENKKKERKEEEAKAAAQVEDESEEEQQEDVKIVADLEAAKAKYEGRRKLAKVDLARSELEEEKENRPKNASAKAGGAGKKKKCMVNEEDFEKKIAVWED